MHRRDSVSDLPPASPSRQRPVVQRRSASGRRHFGRLRLTRSPPPTPAIRPRHSRPSPCRPPLVPSNSMSDPLPSSSSTTDDGCGGIVGAEGTVPRPESAGTGMGSEIAAAAGSGADTAGCGWPLRQRVTRRGRAFSAFKKVTKMWRCTGITTPSFWLLDGSAPNEQNDRTESP